MLETVSLTLAEAGYVVGQSSTAINRAVDRGVIRAELRGRGRMRRREVGAAELRFLKVAGALAGDLTPSGRRRLYDAMRRLPAGARRIDMGPLAIAVDAVDEEIEERLRRLERVRAEVDAGGDEPLIRGTTVPVHVVAGLARGETVDEILEDYPSLARVQVEAAIEYAKAYPKPGRPYPARSFKRMLGDLAEQGFFDAESDPDEVGPRTFP